MGNSRTKKQWTITGIDVNHLADCGFYYTPTKKFPDQITCFWCGKKERNFTDGFANTKSISQYHLANNSECSYSQIASNLEQFIVDSEKETFWQRLREAGAPDSVVLPHSLPSVLLRLATFKNLWKFDSKRDCKVSSRNLARAGFYYSPVDPGSDRTICMYCDCPLEEWDAGDDPLEEHRSNSFAYCYFLLLREKTAVPSTPDVAHDLSNESPLNITHASKSTTPEGLKDVFDLSIEDLDNNDRGTIFQDASILPKRFTRRRVQVLKEKEKAFKSNNSTSLILEINNKENVHQEDSGSVDEVKNVGSESQAAAEIESSHDVEDLEESSSTSEEDGDESNYSLSLEIQEIQDKSVLSGVSSTLNSAGPVKRKTTDPSSGPKKRSKSQFSDDELDLDPQVIEEILNSPKKARKMKKLVKKSESPSPAILDLSNQNLGDYDESNISFIEKDIHTKKLTKEKQPKNLDRTARAMDTENVLSKIYASKHVSASPTMALQDKPILAHNDIIEIESSPSINVERTTKSADEADKAETYMLEDDTFTMSKVEIGLPVAVKDAPKKSEIQIHKTNDKKAENGYERPVAKANNDIQDDGTTNNGTDPSQDANGVDTSHHTGVTGNGTIHKQESQKSEEREIGDTSILDENNKSRQEASEKPSPQMSELEYHSMDFESVEKIAVIEPGDDDLIVQAVDTNISSNAAVMVNAGENKQEATLSNDRTTSPNKVSTSKIIEEIVPNEDKEENIEEDIDKSMKTSSSIAIKNNDEVPSETMVADSPREIKERNLAGQSVNPDLSEAKVPVATNQEAPQTSMVEENDQTVDTERQSPITLSPLTYDEYMEDIKGMDDEFTEDRTPDDEDVFEQSIEIKNDTSVIADSEAPLLVALSASPTKHEPIVLEKREISAEKVAGFDYPDDEKSSIASPAFSEGDKENKVDNSLAPSGEKREKNAESDGIVNYPDSKQGLIQVLNMDGEEIAHSTVQPVQVSPQQSRLSDEYLKSPSPPDKMFYKYKSLPQLEATQLSAFDGPSFGEIEASTPEGKKRPLARISLDAAASEIQTLLDTIEYLAEVSVSKCELHNDAVGVLTQFIAAMPEEEEGMTIEEWMQHNAETCGRTVRAISTRMITAYEEEFDRVMQYVEQMETID